MDDNFIQEMDTAEECFLKLSKIVKKYNLGVMEARLGEFRRKLFDLMYQENGMGD